MAARGWRSGLMGLFSGLYGDHAAAQSGTRTYDDPQVVTRLVEARSAFRWDGVLMPLYQQLAAALLAAAMRGGGFDGRLSVCDFGGGLGNGHAVLSAILGEAVRLEWDVVETPALAQAGNDRFAGGGLRFHDELDALEGREHDLILVSGVLQYLPDPQAVFARLASRPHRHMMMNRFPVRQGAEPATTDLCTVQDLALLQPGVSVPHWCFSEERWRRIIGATHGTVMSWSDDFDGRHRLDDGSELSFIGMLLSRHPAPGPTPARMPQP
ncbi:methyltransferase, TIGR04325 family [Azospirillum sp. TSH100]|nr:methyltransferase, TIGR04325 family [Azospirillum sp. TSH100]